MLLSIDHVVIVVRDLARAVADYARAGFAVTPGGEHTGRATYNALIPFADGTYIELIAFKDPARPHDDPWWRRLQRGEGLVDYALLSNALAADAGELRRRGLGVEGPEDGGRERPDGQRLAWRTLRPAQSPVLPFVIEDVTPRELRVPSGEATRHPLGATRVAGLRVVVADLRASGAAMQALLGGPTDGGPDDADDTGGATRRFAIGQQWIELLRPGDNTEAAAYLRTQGEGPYELALGSGAETAGGGGEPLGGDLHGARIRVAR
jgi:hypothetical protein